MLCVLFSVYRGFSSEFSLVAGSRWMSAATDLAGNPRIHFGSVDIGCYEYIPEPLVAAALVMFFMPAARSVRR